MYILVILFFLIILFCIWKRYSKFELFTDSSIAEYIESKVCDDEALVSIKNIESNEIDCVPTQCNSIKCWYMIYNSNNNLYEFDPEKHHHMRIIDRDDDSKDCIENKNIAEALKQMPVSIKSTDTVEYNAETDAISHTIAEEIIEGAVYICFYQSTNVTTMMDKSISFNDLVKPSDDDINVLINVSGFKDNEPTDEKFVCKKPISDIDDDNNIKIGTFEFKRFLKKRKGNSYEIMYKRTTEDDESTEIDLPIYVYITGKTKQEFIIQKNKNCITNCNDSTDKKFYSLVDDGSYIRKNFVNPIKIIDSCTVPEDTINGELIDSDIYTYDELLDKYKLSFEYNNPNLWYDNGDPSKKKFVKTDCTVIIKEPEKVYHSKKQWIQSTNRECSKKCANDKYDIVFNVDKTKINANTTSDYKYMKEDDTKKQFIRCKNLDIKYTCIKSSQQNDTLIKTSPVITIKKKNKEIVFRHIINLFDIQINKTIDNSVLNKGKIETYFEPFEIFPNEYDNLVLFIDSGGYSIEIPNVLITLKCEIIKHIDKDTKQCNYVKITECDYDNYYYDISSAYSCTQYDKKDCKLNIKSTDQVVCENNANYSSDKKTTNPLPIIHDNVEIVKSYDDCINICDKRQGCVGIDYNNQINKCSFYGYETAKIEVINILENKFNIKIYGPLLISSVHSEKGVISKIFTKPVTLNKIVLEVEDEFIGTVILYDFEGKIQKLFSNNDYEQNNFNHLSRYKTTENIYELEYFYNNNSITET